MFLDNRYYNTTEDVVTFFMIPTLQEQDNQYTGQYAPEDDNQGGETPYGQETESDQGNYYITDPVYSTNPDWVVKSRSKDPDD